MAHVQFKLEQAGDARGISGSEHSSISTYKGDKAMKMEKPGKKKREYLQKNQQWTRLRAVEIWSAAISQEGEYGRSEDTLSTNAHSPSFANGNSRGVPQKSAELKRHAPRWRLAKTPQTT